MAELIPAWWPWSAAKSAAVPVCTSVIPDDRSEGTEYCVWFVVFSDGSTSTALVMACAKSSDLMLEPSRSTSTSGNSGTPPDKSSLRRNRPAWMYGSVGRGAARNVDVVACTVGVALWLAAARGVHAGVTLTPTEAGSPPGSATWRS
jgi:hypothetical protein